MYGAGEAKPIELTGINYLLPNAICKLLASGAILINLYWSKYQEVQLMGMGVATLFSFAFGYLVIICLNLSLAYEIGRQQGCNMEIGIYYQRALVINFIICAFLITPLFYISNKIVRLFVHIDQSLSAVIGEYLFQLVPSIYSFALYDTTQTFLISQRYFLAPLLINIFAFFCHFFLIGPLGAAWSRNMTDFFRCIAIYVHIQFRRDKIESWIEWTIQCFKGWENHLRFYQNIGLTTYTHALFMFLFAVLGYDLPRTQLICHICFINIVQIIFIVNIGLKQGLILKLANCIKNRKIKSTRGIGLQSLKIFSAVSVFILFLMLMYIGDICNFFLTGTSSKEVFMDKYWIMFVCIMTDSLNFSLSSVIKTFNKDLSLIKYQMSFQIGEIVGGYLLCYRGGLGLSGLWYGWIFGNIINTAMSWLMLVKLQKLEAKKDTKVLLLDKPKNEYKEDF